jgi:hypothetical protein
LITVGMKPIAIAYSKTVCRFLSFLRCEPTTPPNSFVSSANLNDDGRLLGLFFIFYSQLSHRFANFLQENSLIPIEALNNICSSLCVYNPLDE